MLASCGYDMTARIWSVQGPAPRQIGATSDHTEFTMGLGWALFAEGLLATASWDQHINVFRTPV